MDIGGAEVQRHVVRQRKVRAIQRLRGRHGNSASGAAQRRRLSHRRLAGRQRGGNLPGVGFNLEGQWRLAWGAIDAGGVHAVEWRIFQRCVRSIVPWEVRDTVATAQHGVPRNRGCKAQSRRDIGIRRLHSRRWGGGDYSRSVLTDRLQKLQSLGWYQQLLRRRIVVRKEAVNFGEWGKYIVAGANVNRQPWPHLPIVLSEETWLPRTEVGRKKVGVAAFARERSDQERRQIIDAVLLRGAVVFLQPEVNVAHAIAALHVASLSPNQRSAKL